jgi:hypothetical protein
VAHIGISAAHTRADVDEALTIIDDVLKEVTAGT